MLGEDILDNSCFTAFRTSVSGILKGKVCGEPWNSLTKVVPRAYGTEWEVGCSWTHVGCHGIDEELHNPGKKQLS